MTSQEALVEESPTRTPSDTRVQVLLKEYDIAHSDAAQLENNTWNTAAILITGSIAGLALLGGTIPDNPKLYDYLLRTAIGALSITLVYWWKRMASVWYFVQNMLYYRIVEIEEELDLFSERYIYYLDRASKGEEYLEIPCVETMISAMKAQYKPLNVPLTANNLGWVLIMVWFIFLASQVAAMLGWF
jgi:hypothetical protein